MKYLILSCFTLLLAYSCVDGEELFYRALREDHSETLLIELAESSEVPWNREALLMLEQRQGSEWMLKELNRLYRKGDTDPAFLKALRREVTVQKDFSHLQQLLRDHPELEQSELYHRLLTGLPLTLEELLERESAEDWRELSFLSPLMPDLFEDSLSLQVLEYRLALLELDYGPARALYQEIQQLSPSTAENHDLLFWGWYGLASDQQWEEPLAGLTSSPKGQFAHGRILRFHGKYSRAAQAFAEGPAGDRSLWYRLDCLLEGDSLSGAVEVVESIPSMGEISYFDDKLQKSLQILVSQGQWDKIEEAADRLALRDEGPVTAHYLWVKARLIHHGFLAGEIEQQYYEEIAKRDPIGWYGLLAQWLLDPSVNPLAALPPGDEEIPGLMNFQLEKNPRENPFLLSPDRILLSLIYRGMESEALEYADRRREGLSLYSAPFLHALYSREEEYLKAINIARWEKTLEHHTPSLASLRREYPLAYWEEVESFALEHSLSPWLLTGLIRTESGFEKKIESHAGARGLMQIMESTASDQAALLRMDSYDLENPEDNLRLGTTYIGWLMARPYIENTTDMLIAYNGGPGNLRSWKQRWGDLPMELFWEAVPFTQSREYPKLVFTGALYYGYLYEDLSPGEELSQLIPPLE